MSEQRHSQFEFDPTAQAQRRLWASVLHSIVHDLCAPHRDYRARQDAERWVGEFLSADFREVTSLAGFDPQAVWDKLSKIAAVPHEDRPWERDVSVQARAARRKQKNHEKAYA